MMNIGTKGGLNTMQAVCDAERKVLTEYIGECCN